MASAQHSRAPTPASEESDSEPDHYAMNMEAHAEVWAAEAAKAKRHQETDLDDDLSHEIEKVELQITTHIAGISTVNKVAVASRLLLSTANEAANLYETMGLIPPFKIRHEDAAPERHRKPRSRGTKGDPPREEAGDMFDLAGSIKLPVLDAKNNEPMIEAAAKALREMVVIIKKSNKDSTWSPNGDQVLMILEFIFLRVFDVDGRKTANDLIRAAQTQSDGDQATLLRTVAASAKAIQPADGSMPVQLHVMYAAVVREASFASRTSTPIGKVAYLKQKAEVVRLYDALEAQLDREDGDCEADALKAWIARQLAKPAPNVKRNKASIKKEFKEALGLLLYPWRTPDASYVTHTINRGRVVHEFIRHFGPGILALLPGDTAQRWAEISPSAIRQCITTCMDAFCSYDRNKEGREAMVKDMIKNLNDMVIEPLFNPHETETKPCDARHIGHGPSLHAAIEQAMTLTRKAQEDRRRKEMGEAEGDQNHDPQRGKQDAQPDVADKSEQSRHNGE